MPSGASAVNFVKVGWLTVPNPFKKGPYGAKTVGAPTSSLSKSLSSDIKTRDIKTPSHNHSDLQSNDQIDDQRTTPDINSDLCCGHSFRGKTTLSLAVSTVDQ